MLNKLSSLAAMLGVVSFFIYVCMGALDEGHQEQVDAARWAAEGP